MDLILLLQDWYCSHCDGDWEHGYGIKIETLDNPGWRVDINLTGTEVAEKKFDPVEVDRTESDWYYCKVKDGIFNGAGGVNNLSDILLSFFNWVNETCQCGTDHCDK